ncbi:MAG: hypothetical protein IJT83_16530 [Victivallales bacterium]|nr:hypothetical protein [Victivallales bacterium]
MLWGTTAAFADDAIFNGAKAFWTTWPRNPSIRLELSEKRDRVVFTADVPGDNPTCYTYINISPGKGYRMEFQLEALAVVQQPGTEAKVRLDFQDAAGHSCGAPMQEWTIRLPEAGGSLRFNREFTAPEGALRARAHLLSLKGIGGQFAISNVLFTQLADEVAVPKTASPIKLDGVLDEAVWQSAGVMEGFYIYGSPNPLPYGTQARMAYDDTALYLAMRCEEPDMPHLVKNITQRDGDVWCDDGAELFIASPNNRAAQFIFNTLGTQFDSEVAQRVPGDPWRNNKAWDGQWKCMVKTDERGWTAEVTIPFENFNATPLAGTLWRVNLVRDRRAGVERGSSSQWNLHFSTLNNVGKFAELAFDENGARLTRHREVFSADPLKIERKTVRFEELPRREGRYVVGGGGGSFLLNFYNDAFRKEHEATWPQEQAKMLEEFGEVMDCPPIGYPWGVKIYGGREKTEELLKKYNWKLPSITHHTGQDRDAIEQGATFVRDRFVDPADPLRHAMTMKWTEEAFKKDAWIIPYLGVIRGNDEPTNTTYDTFSRIKNNTHLEALQKVEDEIRTRYGYGKVGLFDHFASNDDPDAPFRRIAFMRWWNDRVVSYLAEEQALVRKYAPNALYMSVTFNTVSTFRGIEVLPDFARVSDANSVDPYPTATFASCGRERALYHTGFSAKMLHDMTPGTKNHIYIQAFNYWGRSPTRDNMREWASQALKNGADYISWYADGNRGNAPGCYEEMIRLSRIIRNMKPLELPEKSSVAVLYCDLSHWGGFDATQNAEYSLYAVLGEQLKGNFRYVSDIELDDGRAKASDYRLLIAPHLKYTTPATQQKLLEFVQNGGTLLVLDPEAFAFSDDGTSPEQMRKALFNAPLPTEKLAFDKVAMGKWSLKVEEAYRTALPADATLLASYPDGSPAAYSRSIGKGRLMAFAAQPFVTAKLAVEPGDWLHFLGELLEKHGETLGRPHWDFLLPKD